MLTNDSIITIINTVLNKDLSGNSINTSEFQALINAQSQLLFADKLGIPNEYARDIPTARKGAGVSKVLTSDLRPFYVREQLTVIGGVANLASLASTYAYLLAINPASISGRGFKELRPDEVADFLGSVVILPTVDDPNFEWRDSTSLLIYPATIASIIVMYYKEPRQAVVVYTTNGTTLLEEYDAGNSTELEWTDNDKVIIAYRILRDAGVNIEKSDVVALSQQIIDSNS